MVFNNWAPKVNHLTWLAGLPSDPLSSLASLFPHNGIRSATENVFLLFSLSSALTSSFCTDYSFNPHFHSYPHYCYNGASIDTLLLTESIVKIRVYASCSIVVWVLTNACHVSTITTSYRIISVY